MVSFFDSQVDKTVILTMFAFFYSYSPIGKLRPSKKNILVYLKLSATSSSQYSCESQVGRNVILEFFQPILLGCEILEKGLRAVQICPTFRLEMLFSVSIFIIRVWLFETLLDRNVIPNKVKIFANFQKLLSCSKDLSPNKILPLNFVSASASSQYGCLKVWLTEM